MMRFGLLLSLIASVACANGTTFTQLPTIIKTDVPTQATTPQPTEIPLPVGMTRANTLLQWMSSSSLTILEVQNSIEGALFQSPNQAAWIKTDKGIVEVVFFLDPAETTHIQITPLSGPTEARHLYQVQAPPPTVTHDVVIDAAYPLYFSVERGMYMVTNSVELHAVLKRILAEH